MKRALPGQLATLLNTLRFVDAVNALLSRRVVDVVETRHGPDGRVLPPARSCVPQSNDAADAAPAQHGHTTAGGSPPTNASVTTLSAEYDDLMAWGEQALQARFAGATQYLKAAKSYGLVHYGGEMSAFLPKSATFQAHSRLDQRPPPEASAHGAQSARHGGSSAVPSAAGPAAGASGASEAATGAAVADAASASSQGRCLVQSRSLHMSRAQLVRPP